MIVDGEPGPPPRSGGVTNQRKRSLAIAWTLAGLAAVFYVITVVKFDEQLDRVDDRRRLDLAACVDAAPSFRRASPVGASGRRAGEGASSTAAPCG